MSTESELDDLPPQKAVQNHYVVSMGKFSLLFLSTMGLFTVYWFYKNCYLKEIKVRRKPDAIALSVLAAIFPPLFVHSLFNEIEKTAQAGGISYPWRPIKLAWAYVIISVVGLILQLTSSEGQVSTLYDVLIGYPFLMSTYYVFYKAQLVANRVCGDPFGKQNSRFHDFNVLFITFGIGLQVMQFYAVFKAVGPTVE